MKFWYIQIQVVLISTIFVVFARTQEPSENFRLPNTTIPIHYDLQLQPILDVTPGYTRFTAPGKVTITVNCTEETAVVKLHALDLTIIESATTVKQCGSNELINIISFGAEPEHHFFVINLEASLTAGSQYEIYIEFITPISQTRLDGMYLDEYLDPATNETRYVATTLFAAISARRCFPGFDEPQMKAVFSISLGRKEVYHSLSNMNTVSTEPMNGMDGWYLDRFAPSLPMSTYLVAMIVSDLAYEQATITKKAEDTIIRVYAPYYFINRGGGVYAANQTKTVLIKFEEYFNSTYMLQKLDSVSLPRFFFNAMENWALITYNDKVLLYFPGETTEQERYRITNIISHEVAHHYFGNLVTCEWWSWIYLNEGFATYVSHLGVEMTYPEFNPWDRFINDVYQVAMEFDASSSTHPVVNEPVTLADIGGIYDKIAYEKGASLLRMMQSFLTEEVMQTGVRRYIAEKQFSVAKQDELLGILQETAENLNISLPVTTKSIMDTWTLVSGYPLIRVTRLSPTEVKFTQEKFQLEPINPPSTDRWWIPISIKVISSEQKEYFFWMPSHENETIFSIPDSELFLVNPKSDGYYRTLYSVDLLQGIFDSFSNSCDTNPKTTIGSAAKAKLLDDYIVFKKAGYTQIDITTSMIREFPCWCFEELTVWQTLFNRYTSELLAAYETTNYVLSANIKAELQSLQPLINHALLDSPLDGQVEQTILRSELLFWTCYINPDQNHCKDFVKERMDRWLKDVRMETPFLMDFEETYFCIAASLNVTYWERIYELMESRLHSVSKLRLLSSLSCTSNSNLLQRIAAQIYEYLGNFNHSIKNLATFAFQGKAENIPLIRMALRSLDNKNARNFIHIEIM